MGLVPFHMVCDKCGHHQPEYDAPFSCRECMEDVCEGCSTDRDDETCRATCLQCIAEALDALHAEAFMKGRRAGIALLSRELNPFREYTGEWVQWRAGWDSASADQACDLNQRAALARTIA